MNTNSRFAFVSVMCAWLARTALAVPMSITYQGQLNDVTDGVVTPMAGNSATLEVRLWNQAEGGTALWGREIPVTLDNGAFNMAISDQVGSQLIASTLASVIQNASGVLYIGLTVQGGSEIKPRQRMLSSAYAVAAQSAEKAVGAFDVGDHLTVANGMTVAGGAVLNGATTTVSGMLAVSNDLRVTGNSTLYNTTTATRLTVSQTMTANSNIVANGSVEMKGNVFVNTNAALDVQGTFMRIYPLSVKGTLMEGCEFNELALDRHYRAKVDLILCVTGRNFAPYLADNGNNLRVYLGNPSPNLITSIFIEGGVLGTLTVPIPKDTLFYLSRTGHVGCFSGYVTTFQAMNTNNWSNFWE